MTNKHNDIDTDTEYVDIYTLCEREIKVMATMPESQRLAHTKRDKTGRAIARIETNGDVVDLRPKLKQGVQKISLAELKSRQEKKKIESRKLFDNLRNKADEERRKKQDEEMKQREQFQNDKILHLEKMEKERSIMEEKMRVRKEQERKMLEDELKEKAIKDYYSKNACEEEKSLRSAVVGNGGAPSNSNHPNEEQQTVASNSNSSENSVNQEIIIKQNEQKQQQQQQRNFQINDQKKPSQEETKEKIKDEKARQLSVEINQLSKQTQSEIRSCLFKIQPHLVTNFNKDFCRDLMQSLNDSVVKGMVLRMAVLLWDCSEEAVNFVEEEQEKLNNVGGNKLAAKEERNLKFLKEEEHEVTSERPIKRRKQEQQEQNEEIKTAEVGGRNENKENKEDNNNIPESNLLKNQCGLPSKKKLPSASADQNIQAVEFTKENKKESVLIKYICTPGLTSEAARICDEMFHDLSVKRRWAVPTADVKNANKEWSDYMIKLHPDKIKANKSLSESEISILSKQATIAANILTSRKPLDELPSQEFKKHRANLKNLRKKEREKIQDDGIDYVSPVPMVQFEKRVKNNSWQVRAVFYGSDGVTQHEKVKSFPVNELYDFSVEKAREAAERWRYENDHRLDIEDYLFVPHDEIDAFLQEQKRVRAERRALMAKQKLEVAKQKKIEQAKVRTKKRVLKNYSNSCVLKDLKSSNGRRFSADSTNPQEYNKFQLSFDEAAGDEDSQLWDIAKKIFYQYQPSEDHNISKEGENKNNRETMHETISIAIDSLNLKPVQKEKLCKLIRYRINAVKKQCVRKTENLFRDHAHFIKQGQIVARSLNDMMEENNGSSANKTQAMAYLNEHDTHIQEIALRLLYSSSRNQRGGGKISRNTLTEENHSQPLPFVLRRETKFPSKRIHKKGESNNTLGPKKFVLSQDLDPIALYCKEVLQEDNYYPLETIPSWPDFCDHEEENMGKSNVSEKEQEEDNDNINEIDPESDGNTTTLATIPRSRRDITLITPEQRAKFLLQYCKNNMGTCLKTPMRSCSLFGDALAKSFYDHRFADLLTNRIFKEDAEYKREIFEKLMWDAFDLTWFGYTSRKRQKRVPVRFLRAGKAARHIQVKDFCLSLKVDSVGVSRNDDTWSSFFDSFSYCDLSMDIGFTKYISTDLFEKMNQEKMKIMPCTFSQGMLQNLGGPAKKEALENVK